MVLTQQEVKALLARVSQQHYLAQQCYTAAGRTWGSESAIKPADIKKGPVRPFFSVIAFKLNTLKDSSNTLTQTNTHGGKSY